MGTYEKDYSQSVSWYLKETWQQEAVSLWLEQNLRVKGKEVKCKVVKGKGVKSSAKRDFILV